MDRRPTSVPPASPAGPSATASAVPGAAGGGGLMASTNFEFLRDRAASLVDVIAFAEKYTHSDPPSAAVKLRAFAELTVNGLYAKHHFPKPYNASLNDLLNEHVFQAAMPNVVVNHLDLLRRLGNKGAHPERRVDSHEALRGLRDAFAVARWLYIAELGGKAEHCPKQFTEPTPDSSRTKLKKAKKELQQEREARQALEARLEQVIEAERRAQEAAEAALSAQEAAEAERAQTEEVLAELRAQGERVALNVLGLNEAETRNRLIDEQLVAAGWDLTNPQEVGQEVLVSGMPLGSGTGGRTGNGLVDYVLWDDNGQPLAVIEAKRTSKNAEEGRTQAALYADALEKQFGRRPVIFYTNGGEIYIWDDAPRGPEGRHGYPPRRIYGYYAKESLQTLIFRRDGRRSLSEVAINPAIAGRMYQVEAIKRISERFMDNYRRALIVQATGTGKTRVAVSLCDVLSRAQWSKRVLFLCDRKELRKQALNAFKDFLESEPRTRLTRASAGDTKSRIFVGTYPAMMGIYETFDVGFFDLIIADESHRSIYNKYRDLFEYFDCLQVGLTATPVKFVERNTYKLFGCEDQDPTFNYEYEDAVKERYLVPFEVVRVTTKFLREGIKYSRMSPEERAEIEADTDNPHEVEFEAAQIDKQVFNKDTNRIILRNLMDNGIRDATGSRPGKSIIFARSHKHAELLQKLFDEMYPSYGGSFCRVIDNYEPNAEQLIDNFKNASHELTIAISVDMLDTGIDVPEIVNLVFAKPVKSYVKFWQMIGRGTRLCADLFGPGQDKESFRIFDHWENFEYFDERYKPREPTRTKSLQEKLFEARIELLLAAHDALDGDCEARTAKLLLSQVTALRETNAIPTRERWKELEQLAKLEVIQPMHAATKANLLQYASPLMHLVTIRGQEAAYQFDLTMTQLQCAKLRTLPAYEDYKAQVEEHVESLQKNLNPVKAKAEAIRRVRNPDFWQSATSGDLDDLRRELRGVMKHRVRPTGPTPPPEPTYDVKDGGVLRNRYETKLLGLQLVEYRNRVKRALLDHFQENLVLRKIRSNIRVSESDLKKLASLVLEVDGRADIQRLLTSEKERFQGQLYFAFKSVVGLDHDAVDKAFQEFVARYPNLSARQVQFLTMIKNQICENGLITQDELREAPFTTWDADGVDGLFPDEDMYTSLMSIIANFDPANVTSDRLGTPA